MLNPCLLEKDREIAIAFVGALGRTLETEPEPIEELFQRIAYVAPVEMSGALIDLTWEVGIHPVIAKTAAHLSALMDAALEGVSSSGRIDPLLGDRVHSSQMRHPKATEMLFKPLHTALLAFVQQRAHAAYALTKGTMQEMTGVVGVLCSISPPRKRRKKIERKGGICCYARYPRSASLSEAWFP
ncbi:hypothetical protein [Pajaroellobacter abortibovis]|uniref:Uncharacterized protein n=1 Tax=Pajaroellobacter abortibovis TaxID=1882918 RepID=A0A1L6MWK5_9BACT|nr:hypothetical protein [Pajaroellobacter abortibovis]APR99797.1 hypothetical protein BCY86_03230 [Pajaroellobacter abortibovis]